MTRRDFARRAFVLSTAAWAGPLFVPGYREAMARTLDTVTSPAGTTLERSILTTGAGPYFDLTYGPGWPLVVRAELAEPKRDREARRVALTSFLHTTDYQFPDVQSPARVEFLDRFADEPTPTFVSGAFRPQEALVIHATEAIHRQVRSVSAGPVTGRPLDFTICTGDNFDNAQLNELRWFLTLMNGGEVRPNSGDPEVFESVQSFDAPEFYDPHYYHPEPVDDLRGPDNYKKHFGFPDYPGLLPAAGQPFTAVGVGTPWYSLWGNHDALVQGNAPPNPTFEAIATGPLKVLAPPPGLTAGDLFRGLAAQDPTVIAALSLAPARPVTADPDRRFISGSEYIRFHLEAGGEPAGHGYTEDNLDRQTLYYTFDIAPRILGIGLDTTSPQVSEGSMGETQLGWLEARLEAVHSRHLDSGGAEVHTGNEDRLVVLFSHHRAASMVPMQGPDHAGRVEQRYGGDAVLELLERFPNVIAWVNGHSHFNRVEPHARSASGAGGWWDITTSAQIDPPQQARIIEVVDNRDGTLSILTTIIDHAGPPRTEVGAYGVEGLAAISRELAFNDYQSDWETLLGTPQDLNVELLLPAPFTVTPPAAAPPVQTPVPSPTPALPATGGGLGGVAVGALAIGAATALRRRTSGD